MKQGRIHGNPVADGLAGAVMRKLLGFRDVTRAFAKSKPSTAQNDCKLKTLVTYSQWSIPLF